MVSTEEIKKVAKLIKVSANPITHYHSTHRDLLRHPDYRPVFYTNIDIPLNYLYKLDNNLKNLPYTQVQNPHPPVLPNKFFILSEHPGKKAETIVVATIPEIWAAARNELFGLKRTSLRKKLYALRDKYNFEYCVILSRYVYIYPLTNNIKDINFEGYKKFIK